MESVIISILKGAGAGLIAGTIFPEMGWKTFALMLGIIFVGIKYPR